MNKLPSVNNYSRTELMLGCQDKVWTFVQDGSGYYGIDPLGNRRNFRDRDEIRHMCEYYYNLGWKKVLPQDPGLFWPPTGGFLFKYSLLDIDG